MGEILNKFFPSKTVPSYWNINRYYETYFLFPNGAPFWKNGWQSHPCVSIPLKANGYACRGRNSHKVFGHTPTSKFFSSRANPFPKGFGFQKSEKEVLKVVILSKKIK